MPGLADTSLPWLIGGDFNIMRKAEEKLGENEIDFNGSAEFNDCLALCGLMEMAFTGNRFTWQKSG